MRTDLHLHGLLSAPFAVYEAIAGKPLPPLPKKFASFEAFNDYLFQNFIFAIRSADHIRAIIRGAFQRLIDDGVAYAEVSFDVLIPELLAGDAETIFSILSEERERVASHVLIRLEIGISRRMPPETALEKVKEWVKTGIFSSVDLYDDERVGKAADFVPTYRFCEEAGLKLKAHVGEFGPAWSVQDYVETLRLHAVQHGIRAADDPHVMEFLARKGTTLNICPTSNVALGACASYREHPAKKLFDAGVSITVNTDDYALFGASLSDEIGHLEEMGFSPNDVVEILWNGWKQKNNPHHSQ